MKDWFGRFATWCANAAGHPAAFILAVATTLLWAASGPFLGFSNTWQLAINTLTTLSTGLLVFLIQNSQNRHSAAIQVKLDALLKTDPDDHDDIFIGIEDLTEPELAHLKQRIREEADAILARRKE